MLIKKNTMRLTTPLMLPQKVKWLICLMLPAMLQAQEKPKPVGGIKDSAKTILQNVKQPLTTELGKVKNISKELKAIPGRLKPSFEVKSLSLGYSVPNMQILSPNQRAIGFLTLQADASATVGGVPFTLQSMGNNFSDATQGITRSFNQLGFDKDLFIKNIQSRITKDILEKVKAPIEKQINSIKEKLINDAAQELQGIKNEYGKSFTNLPDIINKPETFVDQTTAQLKEQALRFAQDSIAHKTALMQQIKQRVSLGEKIDESYISHLENDIAGLAKKQTVYEKIIRLKEKIEQSGAVEKIKQLQQQSGEIMNTIQNNPAELRNVAAKYLPVKGLEKIFLMANQFKAGQSVAAYSKLSMNGYSMNGLNAEFQKGKNSVAVVAGKENLNNLFDQGTMPFLRQSTGSVTGFRLGRVNEGSTQTHIAFFHYRQTTPIDLNMPGLNFPLPNNDQLNRNASVITFSNQSAISANSTVEIEYSRSFSGTGKSNDVKQNNQQSTSSSLFRNAALDIKFNGTIQSIGLQHKVKFTYVDLAYNNPGNPFLQRGFTEGSLDLKKDFFDRKLRVQTRAIYTQFDYNAGNSFAPQIKRFNYLLDIKGRFKHGQYIGIRYQPNINMRVADGQTGIAGETNRLSMEGAFRARLFNKPYRHQLTIGTQQSFYTGLLGSNVQFENRFINSFQTLTLGKNSVYWTSVLNKTINNSGSAVFNSSALTEAGFNCNLSERITGSAGLLYNYTEGLNEQVGTRLSVNGQLSKAFVLSVFAAMRVITRKISNEFFINNSRVDISLQYTINRK